MFEVYWIGGEKDGQTVGRFETEREAIKFANAFWKDHEEEFDPVCGGVGIVDPDGAVVEW